MNAKRSMIVIEIMVRVVWLLFERFFHFVSALLLLFVARFNKREAKQE